MIERVVNFAVDRRWLVLLATLVAVIFGGFALSKLPIDAVPDITNNQVQINASAPALSPNDIERQVTWPLETSLAGIPGLESTRSLTRNGFAQVTAVFAEDVDIYFARQQVAERLRSAEEALPAGVAPEMGPISTGLGDVFMWTIELADKDKTGHPDGEPGLQSDGSYLTPEGERLITEAEKVTYLRTVQDWIVAPQLKGVDGVAGIDVIGGYVKQYVVSPDPQKLAAAGISLSQLAEALERSNTSAGAGTIELNGESLTVRADARALSADELAQRVIATRSGVPILLSQVASVKAGQAVRFGSASENGQEIVVGTAVMRIGGNSRTVSTAVDSRLKEIQKSLPRDVVVKPVLNRTALVDATIETVARNLTEGALLVIAVLFLLLGNFRAALIAALVIPFTMLITAMGMLKGGVSANLMSLGALDFGLIVDGAVIIVENALRRLGDQQHAKGGSLTLAERLATVAAATREMIRPSVFGQMIIIIVYLPLLTFTGVEGKMFQPMALTVIFALVAAFVLSLTFVPALIAVWLSKPVSEKENRIIAWLGRAYRPALDKALVRPKTVIITAAAALVGGGVLFATLGQEFLPQLDEKDILLQVSRIPGTSVAQSQLMQYDVERAVSKIPEVKFAFSRTGTAELAADPMPPNATDTFIILKHRKQWPDKNLSKAEVVEKVEAAVAHLPGQAYELTQPIQMRFNELLAGVRGDIAVKVYGDDFGAMTRTANAIAAAMQKVDGAVDIKVEATEGLPMLDVKLNTQALATSGLTPADVYETLGTALAGKDAGVIFEGDRRFSVVVRLDDTLRQDLEAIRLLPIATPSGGFVPLSAVATLETVDGPNQISRENGKRRVVVQANVRGRDIAGVVADAQKEIAADVTLAPGQWLQWGGQFENLASARDRLLIVVPICFAAIIMLLYLALGTWRETAIVFTGVPLALVGGIAALFLRGLPFSISAAVGFIALSGIAVLNGLVLMNAIKDMVANGASPAEAARAGALSRLRPVIMTALVASLGFVPMAISHGAGAEVQRPLATVVIGGLITATLLTLFVLPTLYAKYGLRPRRGKARTETQNPAGL